MKAKKQERYFQMDILRCTLSGKMLAGVAGVIVSMIFAVANMINTMNSVIGVITLVASSMPFLVSLPFCALPYADCFCEDLQYKYIYAQMIRGNLKKYVLSKAVVIFGSSTAAMTLGVLAYTMLLRLKFPWRIEAMDSYYNGLAMRNGLVRENHFIAYILLFAVQFGLLAGVLSLLGAYVSLFYTNKLLILTVPVMAYYFLIYYNDRLFPNIPWLNLTAVFNLTNYNVWANDMLSFLWAFGVAFVLSLVLTLAIYKKLERRISGE